MLSYETLEEETAESVKNLNSISTQIKQKESRLNEISELQKQISNYSRTLDVYRSYRDSGWDKKYYWANEGAIILHRAAKKYFDRLGMKKLPPMQSLKQEYASLCSEKNKLYTRLKPAREKIIKLKTAKQNVEMILGEPRQYSKSHGRDAR